MQILLRYITAVFGGPRTSVSMRAILFTSVSASKTMRKQLFSLGFPRGQPQLILAMVDVTSL
jgi:hypothetical protein